MTDSSFPIKGLQDFEFLRGLDHATLAALSKSAVWKVFPPNAVVFWEGDTESILYYLQYGSLKALRTASDGRKQVLRFWDAGEVFNEIGVLAKHPNPGTRCVGRGGNEVSADGVADHWQHGR